MYKIDREDYGNIHNLEHCNRYARLRNKCGLYRCETISRLHSKCNIKTQHTLLEVDCKRKLKHEAKCEDGQFTAANQGTTNLCNLVSVEDK